MPDRCGDCGRVHPRCAGHHRETGEPCGRRPNVGSTLCYRHAASNSDQPSCEKCGQPHRPNGCIRHNGQGQPCGRSPIKGAAVCRSHGGAAPQILKGAEKRRQQMAVQQAVATFGLPVDISPEQALLDEVHRTAGHVAWLGQKVAALEADDLTWGVTKREDIGATEFTGVNETQAAAVNVWVQLYQTERKHLVAVCKAAIDAGIAERHVRLAEEQGRLVGELLRIALDAAGIDEAQEARAYDAVSRRLTLVAG